MKYIHSAFSIRNSLAAILLTACLVFSAASVSGQTRVMKQLEEKRKSALEEIEWTSQLLRETRSSAQSSLNRLNLLAEQMVARRQIISLLNQEIALMDKEIAGMNAELSELGEELDAIRIKYARSLQNIYTRRSIQYKWYFVLSAETFTQSIRRMRYLREYSGWQKHQVALIIKKQTETNLKQMEIEQARTEKLSLLDIREKESSRLQEEEAEQKAEARLLAQKQKDLQAELHRKKKEAEALDRQIENLINSEINRALATDAPAGTPATGAGKSGKRRSASPESGYLNTKEERQLSSNFASNRGRLPYPLTGKYKIVSPFGEVQHPELKHVRTYNSGIDIQTTAGTEAQAVFIGTVTAVFTVETGYNHCIIIRHGRYLTVYGNLRTVYVKQGDKVSTRQKLGKISTDIHNATILHFEIRREKEKLNPRLWLN
ncbi:MAG: peptidoglycan DD-metalloendopeptidase family protein [Tannerella sp.]|jgi:septal ring factor EnvC (AmiA/AmiB activator)|nr:peptidoglycan DD-metalloendopeptidase family protein [Tannerella sp.]